MIKEVHEVDCFLLSPARRGNDDQRTRSSAPTSVAGWLLNRKSRQHSELGRAAVGAALSWSSRISVKRPCWPGEAAAIQMSQGPIRSRNEYPSLFSVSGMPSICVCGALRHDQPYRAGLELAGEPVRPRLGKSHDSKPGRATDHKRGPLGRAPG